MNKAVAVFDRLVLFSLCVIIFSLSFSVSLVEIFFVISLVSWIIKKTLLRDFRMAFTPLSIPIYVFLLAAVLSVVFSASLCVSLRALFSKLIKWALLYFITVESLSNRKRLQNIFIIIFISAFFVCADSLFQYFIGKDFISGHVFSGRLTGPFKSPNALGGWLVVICPLILGVIYSLKYVKNSLYIKFTLLFLMGILLCCLFFTRSRGACLAALAAFLFMTFLIRRRYLFWIILGAVFVYCILPYDIKCIIHSMCDVRAGSGAIRIRLWKEAFSIIADFPLLGTGFNTYTIVGSTYVIPGGGGWYPHNSYLHLAAEIGLLGLGAYLWIVYTLFKTSLAAIYKNVDKFYSSILAGLLAGIAGFLVQSFFDTNIYAFQLNILMWFIMGLIVAVQKVALKEPGR